jgi:hypothetical protein
VAYTIVTASTSQHDSNQLIDLDEHRKARRYHSLL